MKHLWEITLRITHNKIDASKLFITMTTIFCGAIGLLIGIIASFIFNVTGMSLGVLLFCTTGYSALFIGFFGGGLYVLRK